jgi:hypothetical protein
MFQTHFTAPLLVEKFHIANGHTGLATVEGYVYA